MDRTTPRNRIGTRSIRRLTALALAGSAMTLVAAAPVQAQTIGADGKIYAVADCNLKTKTANVWVYVMEPSKYATSGLVFYTEVWAKARSDTKYNLIRSGESSVIKTWSKYNPNPYVSSELSWMNDPKVVTSTAFTGRVEAYYDIYVKYWFRVPASSNWAGPYGFTAAGDQHSAIYITSNDGFGNLTSPASNCYL